MQKHKKSGRLQTLFPPLYLYVYITGGGGGKNQKDPSGEPATRPLLQLPDLFSAFSTPRILPPS